jgi:hypothetical protein
VPKGERRLGGLSDMIISLYAGGMRIRDIQAHLEPTLGTELSHETISNITDAVVEEVRAWQSRPLEPVYPILYLDALIVKVRDSHAVRNKAAHIAVGVDPDGIKHVLGIWVQTSEGVKMQPPTGGTILTAPSTGTSLKPEGRPPNITAELQDQQLYLHSKLDKLRRRRSCSRGWPSRSRSPRPSCHGPAAAGLSAARPGPARHSSIPRSISARPSCTLPSR